MSNIFLKILNMSIAASYLILAVLLAWLILRKAPRWICVLLWGLVALRLIFPVSIESIFSLIPSAETVSPEIMTDPTPQIHTGIPAVNYAVNPVISQSFAPTPGDSANPLQIWTAVASVVWLAGMAGMLCYMAVSYFLVHRKVRTAVKYKDNLFQSENVDSPFVLGLFRPKIYLPFAIGEEDLSYVVAHEQAHIRRKDHWWKPFGFLLLTVYWFNPLMWLGYILLCRDIEFACDEKVIAGMDNGAKADYSQALVACSVHRRRIAACPLAFGEVGVKERVKSVMNYRKPAFWIILIALISCIILAVCFLTNPKTEDPNDSETEAKTHATAPSDEILPTDAIIPPNIYAVTELTYEFSVYSFALTPGENTPVYAVSEDMELSELMQKEGQTVWEKLGKLTPIELTQENFDNRCSFPSTWVEGCDAPTIRENNRQAWQLLYGATTYTLLLQKNGDIYLAFGYQNETTDHVRWLFKLAPESANIVNTYVTGYKTYYELSDGTWQVDGRTYKHRLVITGRMHKAAADSTFVYLSNLENISFDRAWKAAGFSSSADDYFSPEEAVLVDAISGGTGEEDILIAQSGNYVVPLLEFPTGTPRENYAPLVQWLTIDPGDATVPFSIFQGEKKHYGFYTVFDAVTYELLEFVRPSGLLPQTYLFQNADPSRSYIVLVRLDSGTQYAFGARFPTVGDTQFNMPLIDSISYDIDHDGKNEMCTLTHGFTSGVQSFCIYASGMEYTAGTEYCDHYVYFGPYDLSFEITADQKLRIKGTHREQEETVYFDIDSVKDGRIYLHCEKDGILMEHTEN